MDGQGAAPDTGQGGFDLIKTRFREGIWEGLLTSRATDLRPEIAVTLHGAALSGVTVTPADAPGRWGLAIPVPVEAVAEGVQTFVISDMTNDTVLGSFTLIAGEVLTDDLRAEVDLLRAELDLLKRAFRRHCLET